MFTHKFCIAWACLSVATALSLFGQPVAEDTTAAKSTVVAAAEKMLLPDGIAPKDLNSDKAIEKAFKAVTEDAMNMTGFDHLVSRLVDQDRNRISYT